MLTKEIMLSILKLIFIACHTAVACPVIVGTAVIDERQAWRICQLWARVNLAVCGTRVHVRNLGDLDPSTAYVFMSNHRSHFDILAVMAALPDFQLRWVAKKELTNIPIFGWALQRTGHIIIDRSDHVQSMASLRAARKQMAEGRSVVIFPEGTRGSAEELLPFKKGGFVLALETGFPIVPLAVKGSDQVLPRDSWFIQSGDIEVVIGTPLPVGGVSREELMRRVKGFMVRELQGPPPMPRRRVVPAEAS